VNQGRMKLELARALPARFTNSTARKGGRGESPELIVRSRPIRSTAQLADLMSAATWPMRTLGGSRCVKTGGISPSLGHAGPAAKKLPYGYCHRHADEAGARERGRRVSFGWTPSPRRLPAVRRTV